MSKHIIICGSDDLKKNALINALTKFFNQESLVRINTRITKKELQSHFFLSSYGVDDTTEVVIAGEIESAELVNNFIVWCSGRPFKIDVKYKWPYEVNPKFILVMRDGITVEQIKSQGASITRRFEIIEA